MKLGQVATMLNDTVDTPLKSNKNVAHLLSVSVSVRLEVFQNFRECPANVIFASINYIRACISSYIQLLQKATVVAKTYKTIFKVDVF